MISKIQLKKSSYLYAICFNFMPYHFYNQIRKPISITPLPFPCRAEFTKLWVTFIVINMTPGRQTSEFRHTNEYSYSSHILLVAKY